MKQEQCSLTSRAFLFISLLCLVGVLHVEYKLHKHETTFLRESIHVKIENTAEVERLPKSYETEIKRLVKDKDEIPDQRSRVRRSSGKNSRNISSLHSLKIWQDIKKELFLLKKEKERWNSSSYCSKCPRGPRGRRGRPGRQGKTGIHGLAGPRGPTGVAGPPGPKGDQGLIGLTGARGYPGKQGSSLVSPSIHVPQKTITVNVSDTTWLPCVAKGNPAPKVTWVKINGRLPIGRHEVLASGLSIKDVTSEDEGIYSCVARSALGVSKVNVTLIVQVAPRIVQITSSQIVYEGAIVTLLCRASGRPSPNITWSKGFGRIPDNRATEKSGTFVISGIKMRDSGVYACQAKNILGKTMTTTQIIAIEVLRFDVEPILVSVPVLKRRLVINCKVVGATNMEWKKDDKLLYPSNLVFPNGTLVIPNFNVEDFGIYVLTARNFQRSITARVHILQHIPTKDYSYHLRLE